MEEQRMKKSMAMVMAAAIVFVATGSVSAAGYNATSDLWI